MRRREFLKALLAGTAAAAVGAMAPGVAAAKRETLSLRYTADGKSTTVLLTGIDAEGSTVCEEIPLQQTEDGVWQATETRLVRVYRAFVCTQKDDASATVDIPMEYL